MRGHFQESKGSIRSGLKDNQNRSYLVMKYQKIEYKHLQKDVFCMKTYTFIKIWHIAFHIVISVYQVEIFRNFS